MTEKEFALEIKKKFLHYYYNYENFSSLYYPETSIPVDNMNFELLKEELVKYDIKVSKGCELGNISKHYIKEWNKFKTIFIYAEECDL